MDLLKPQKKNPVFVGIFLFSMVVIGVFLTSFESRAGSVGVVSGASSLNIRTGPGTSYDNVMTADGSGIALPNGYSVTIISEDYDENKSKWYEISFTYENTEYIGYALADYIRIRNTANIDNDFEGYLNSEGFPESYKEDLRILHTEHPNWVFEAHHTGLDWTAAVNAESEVGKNLIPNSAISSWKSMETGAYNWETNTWVVFDGSDWVSASRELIAYYMDPRNFLDSTFIFQFETLSYDNTYQTVSGVQNILNNSFMSGSYTDTDGWTGTYAEAFMYAAEKSGVSPYHLASRALQELSPSGSSSVSGTVSGYEGYFNFYNIGATSSSNPILLGLAYAMQYNDTYFLPWNTKWKAIAGGAIYLGKRYINIGQDTLYLQKFNVQGTNPYTHQYMTNVQAPSAEAKKMVIAYGAALDQEIIFKIPVFDNMPSEPSPMPTGSGSSNTALAELSVDGYTLTPTFNRSITEYDLVLNESVDFINVSVRAADASSTVQGDGRYTLQEGLNNVKIVVSAPNGSSTTYTINIVLPSGPSTYNGGNYTIYTGDKLFMDIQDQNRVFAILHGIEVGTLAPDLLKTISSTNCNVKIVNADRTENTGVVATGNYLQITAEMDGAVIKEIPIVIYGDINGDGDINGRDMLYLQRHLLGTALLSGEYAEAADINWDDRVDNADGIKASTLSARDMLHLQRHLLDFKKISQK